MAVARAQEYDRDRRGRRYAVHTRGYAACRCKRCWARLWWTTERRAERSAELRRQYADGRRVWHPASNLARTNHWTGERDDLLREFAGHVDAPTLVEIIRARSGFRYTERAVGHRIRRLGILLLARRPYTTGEVARMFGMSRENLLTVWIRPGHLRGARRRGGQYGMHTFTRTDLEQMAHTYAERLDPERIHDEGLRLLVIARTRGRQLVGTRDVTRATGVTHHVQSELYRLGMVPSARLVRRSGSGRYGAWMLEQADIETVRRLAAERHVDQERRRLSRARDSDGRYRQDLLATAAS